MGFSVVSEYPPEEPGPVGHGRGHDHRARQEIRRFVDEAEDHLAAVGVADPDDLARVDAVG